VGGFFLWEGLGEKFILSVTEGGNRRAKQQEIQQKKKD